MSQFNEAYRHMLRKEVICPKCGAMNTPKASDTVLINPVGTRAECSVCSFERPVEAFMPKAFGDGRV